MSYYPEQMHRMSTASMLREWREHGGKYRLEGSKCTDCGVIFFPRRVVCGACNSLHVENYRCKQTGVIEVLCEATNPVLASMGYGEVIPRHIAMVKLDDGLVIATEIVDVTDTGKLKVGARAKMVIRKHKRESNLAWQYAYKFILSE